VKAKASSRNEFIRDVDELLKHANLERAARFVLSLPLHV
jgi:hypothetical protein